MRTSFSVSTTIAASPSQVFRFLANPSTAAVIDPAVVSYEPEGGTMGLGVNNHLRLKFFGVTLTLISETIGWEPGPSTRPVGGRRSGPMLGSPHPRPIVAAGDLAVCVS